MTIHREYSAVTCVAAPSLAGLTGLTVSTTRGCEEKRKTWAMSGREAPESSKDKPPTDLRLRRA